MKHFALLISILSITLSCSNQKNTSKKPVSDSTKIDKIIPIQKPKFSPSTLALNVKITNIISHDNYQEITATIEKRLGTGAGIVGIYTKGKTISFKTNQKLNLEIKSAYSFLFRETQSMSKKKNNLDLIREIK